MCRAKLGREKANSAEFSKGLSAEDEVGRCWGDFSIDGNVVDALPHICALHVCRIWLCCVFYPRSVRRHRSGIARVGYL